VSVSFQVALIRDGPAPGVWLDMEPVDQERVEALVRAYAGKVARRYAPLAIGLLALLIVVIAVPTRSPTTPAVSAGGGALPASGPSSPAPGAVAPSGSSPVTTAAPAPIGSGPGPGPAGSSGPGPAGLVGAGTGAAPATAAGPKPGGTAPRKGAAPGAPRATAARDTARSGVSCGRGVRQVPWSAYAPPCVPLFTASNGGATAPGVTGTTVTLSFRVGNSAQDAAVYAAAGAAAPAPDAEYIADLQTYISLFNREFELYGRHVVLKSFNGQGDYILEDQGQDQAQAQADAVTARDLGAFADVTFQLKGSNPYWTALAQQHVLAMGPIGFPESYYQQYAPYWWAFSPSGSDGADYLGNAVCQRAAGLPAVYAGEADLQSRTRTFGLITPDNPEYQGVGNEIQANLAGCGVKLAKRISYAINVTTYESEATSIVAQLKVAGVTSVICYCDPIVPIFISDSAAAQGYYPEWFEPNYLDPQGRLENQSEWAHAISDGGTYPPKAGNEAYQAFELADPHAQPRELYYDQAYFTLLQLFIGLQAAGPDLTPVTFERGMSSLPESALGMMGHWQFGPGQFTPPADLQVGWWDPNATSNRDGGKGAWQSCEGGRWFPISTAARSAWGPAHTQLACFGH
jgi:hypothetical protein